MLVVESWLAAPLMLLQNNSPALLATVPVAFNIAVTVLLYLQLTRPPSTLPPAFAALATLPVALPSVSVAGELSEPLGMNVEPIFFALLLWLLRDRPIALGVAAAIGVKNREFVLYAIAAMLLVDALRDRSAAWWRSRAASAVAFGVTWWIIGVLTHYSTPFGPGTTISSLGDAGDNMAKAASTVCIAPATIPHDVVTVATELLPFQFGVHAAPLGVATHGGEGTVEASWLWPALVAVFAVGIVRGLAHGRAHGASPIMWFGLYLVLVGAQAVSVYATTRCGNVGYVNLRYTLLCVLMASGAIVLALERERSRIFRDGRRDRLQRVVDGVPDRACERRPRRPGVAW